MHYIISENNNAVYYGVYDFTKFWNYSRKLYTGITKPVAIFYGDFIVQDGTFDVYQGYIGGQMSSWTTSSGFSSQPNARATVLPFHRNGNVCLTSLPTSDLS